MKDFKNYKCSLQQAEPNFKDWQFSKIVTMQELPRSYSLEKYLCDIKDQKETGFCHSYSGASMKESQEYIERGYKQEFSPLYLAKKVKSIDNQPTTEGTTGEFVCKALYNYGTTMEQFYPSNEYIAGSFNFPSDKDIDECFKIGNYAKCNNSYEMKQAIAMNKFVLLGFQANREIYNVYSESEIPEIPLFDANGRFFFAGGHMVLAYGYDEDYIYIQNSWGEDWGFNGKAKISTKYIDYKSDIGMTLLLDSYCTIDLDNDIKDVSKIELYLNNPIAKINDLDVTLDTPPTIKNDRIVVPIRFLTETFGADVIWIETRKEIQITQGNNKLVMNIGNDIMSFNGKPIKLNVEPYIENDRALLPLRDIAEVLNYIVLWDGVLQKATILKK